MNAPDFRRALELIAREQPDVLTLPLAHPAVVAAFEELERQEREHCDLWDGADFVCNEAHAGALFSTASELFLHLLTCEAFRARHVSPAP